MLAQYLGDLGRNLVWLWTESSLPSINIGTLVRFIFNFLLSSQNWSFVSVQNFVKLMDLVISFILYVSTLKYLIAEQV